MIFFSHTDSIGYLFVYFCVLIVLASIVGCKARHSSAFGDKHFKIWNLVFVSNSFKTGRLDFSLMTEHV